MAKIPLITDKSECCGCGVCTEVCPKNAVSMYEDEYGFFYPQIDDDLCIECNKCVKSCAIKSHYVTNSPRKTYAAVSRDEDLLMKSASGGIFASIARVFLECGGVVFGAAYDKDKNVKHIYIDNEAELVRLQGSKYVQSNTIGIYSDVKKFLEEGRNVLFSGTPCQVASLYGYLGKDYNNLLTVDLVCHGVPNNRMFKEYLDTLKICTSDTIKEFTFRDKKLGWGINGKVTVVSNGKMVERKLWQSASSYLYYFTEGLIYRDSCYNCKYACSNRIGDLTIGDYWGIEKVHVEYVGKTGWSSSSGISLVVANTDAGVGFIQKSDNIELKESDFEKASSGNAQLRSPSCITPKRNEILTLYAKKGWNAVDTRFNKSIGIRKYSGLVKSLMPESIKIVLKRFLK